MQYDVSVSNSSLMQYDVSVSNVAIYFEKLRLKSNYKCKESINNNNKKLRYRESWLYIRYQIKYIKSNIPSI